MTILACIYHSFFMNGSKCIANPLLKPNPSKENNLFFDNPRKQITPPSSLLGKKEGIQTGRLEHKKDNLNWSAFTYNSPQEKAFWNKLPDCQTI